MLSKKEKREAKILIRLGDTPKEAIKTIKDNRKSEYDLKEIDDFYRFAYHN